MRDYAGEDTSLTPESPPGTGRGGWRNFSVRRWRNLGARHWHDVGVRRWHAPSVRRWHDMSVRRWHDMSVRRWHDMSVRRWRNRLVASPGFQSWASRMPGAARIARGEGEALMDLVSGFVYSQVLLAVVELDLPGRLEAAPLSADELALGTGIAPQRMAALCQAAAALRLLDRLKDGRFALAQRGAALSGVPGLTAMIRHHGALYRDLADPVALLRGPEQTELAAFWPYVFGAAGAGDPQVAATYSTLMADSQALVAEETLRAVSFRGTAHLLDVGGGNGAFLCSALRANPGLRATLLDLPAVMPQAEAHLAAEGLRGRVTLAPGSFRDAALPMGADAISLIRVLYDHADDTVDGLLARAHTALPSGGRIVVSEPMSGGARPRRATDAYFAFYCMAMQTGRVRSAAEIGDSLARAGFTSIRNVPTARPFLTSVVTARRGN